MKIESNICTLLLCRARLYSSSSFPEWPRGILGSSSKSAIVHCRFGLTGTEQVGYVQFLDPVGSLYSVVLTFQREAHGPWCEGYEYHIIVYIHTHWICMTDLVSTCSIQQKWNLPGILELRQLLSVGLWHPCHHMECTCCKTS